MCGLGTRVSRTSRAEPRSAPTRRQLSPRMGGGEICCDHDEAEPFFAVGSLDRRPQERWASRGLAAPRLAASSGEVHASEATLHSGARAHEDAPEAGLLAILGIRRTRLLGWLRPGGARYEPISASLRRERFALAAATLGADLPLRAVACVFGRSRGERSFARRTQVECGIMICPPQGNGRRRGASTAGADLHGMRAAERTRIGPGGVAGAATIDEDPMTGRLG